MECGNLAGQPTLPGVATCRGVRESRKQGEGGQVTGYQNREVGEMPSAETEVMPCVGWVGAPADA